MMRYDICVMLCCCSSSSCSINLMLKYNKLNLITGSAFQFVPQGIIEGFVGKNLKKKEMKTFWKF